MVHRATPHQPVRQECKKSERGRESAGCGDTVQVRTPPGQIVEVWQLYCAGAGSSAPFGTPRTPRQMTGSTTTGRRVPASPPFRRSPGFRFRCFLSRFVISFFFPSLCSLFGACRTCQSTPNRSSALRGRGMRMLPARARGEAGGDHRGPRRPALAIEGQSLRNDGDERARKTREKIVGRATGKAADGRAQGKGSRALLTEGVQWLNDCRPSRIDWSAADVRGRHGEPVVSSQNPASAI